MMSGVLQDVQLFASFYYICTRFNNCYDLQEIEK